MSGLSIYPASLLVLLLSEAGFAITVSCLYVYSLALSLFNLLTTVSSLWTHPTKTEMRLRYHSYQPIHSARCVLAGTLLAPPPPPPSYSPPQLLISSLDLIYCKVIAAQLLINQSSSPALVYVRSRTKRKWAQTALLLKESLTRDF